MRQEVLLLFLIIFALFLMQSIGGYFQIRDYKKAVSRVHTMGNVGIGQKKGSFFSGHIVLIACDSGGLITGGEILDGMTFLSKFHPLPDILGKEYIGASIYEFLNEFRSFDERRKKRYLGYIRSLEALEQRLLPDQA